MLLLGGCKGSPRTKPTNQMKKYKTIPFNTKECRGYEVRTKSGKKVEIVKTDASFGNGHSVVGLVTLADDSQVVATYTADGQRFLDPSDEDLVLLPDSPLPFSVLLSVTPEGSFMRTRFYCNRHNGKKRELACAMVGFIDFFKNNDGEEILAEMKARTKAKAQAAKTVN